MIPIKPPVDVATQAVGIGGKMAKFFAMAKLIAIAKYVGIALIVIILAFVVYKFIKGRK